MIYQMMSDVTQNIRANIHSHPFNIELSQGTLPQDKFIFYLIQDSFYLAEFSRALAITAGRLQHHFHRRQFTDFTLGAIESEQALHTHYLNTYEINLDDSQPSPTCFMYTNYLLNIVSLASIEEAIASVLPCFVIYQEVGFKMLQYQHEAHPYRDWIGLYGSSEFESSTKSAIDIVNFMGSSASTKLQEKMISAFVRSAQLEWYFWQGAYHREMWLL